MDVLPLGLVGDGALRAAVAADREVTRMEGVRADHLAQYLAEASESWVPPRVQLRGVEQLVAIAGQGAPRVPELAICEVAAALNLSQPAATSLCADVLDLTYRLPRVAANLRSGELPFAKARLIARRTRELGVAHCELVQERLLRSRATGRGPVPVATLVPMGRLRTMVDQAVLTVRGPEDEAEAAARVAQSLYVELVHTADGATDLAARLATADAARLDARLDQVAGWLAHVGDDRSKPVLRAVALGLLADSAMLRALDKLRREHGSGRAERGRQRTGEVDSENVLDVPDPPPAAFDEPDAPPDEIHGPTAPPDELHEPTPPPDEIHEPAQPPDELAGVEPEPGALDQAGAPPPEDVALLPQVSAEAYADEGGREPPDTLDLLQPPDLGEPPDPLQLGPPDPRESEPLALALPEASPPNGSGDLRLVADRSTPPAPARPAGVAGLPAGVWEKLAGKAAALPSTVLYLHLDAASGTWCEESAGALSREQAMALVGHSRVSVRPVLDLATNLTYTGYTAPPRLREQLALLNAGYCTFPGCGRRARTGDVDHRDPWPRGFADPTEGGRTESRNTHLLCRKHHRAKTFAGWRVHSPTAGVWIWRSPAGAYFLVTGGTTTGLNGALGPATDPALEHEVTHDFADIG